MVIVVIQKQSSGFRGRATFLHEPTQPADRPRQPIPPSSTPFPALPLPMTDPDQQGTASPTPGDIPPKAPRTIEIADGPGSAEDSPESGYGNLWIPLLVVPAGIVFAIVGIFALFGSLSGSEGDLSENLALVVSGGKNERQQALFNLARQAAENQRAAQAGEEAAWPISAGFTNEVKSALEGMDADEYETRLVLAVLLCALGEDHGTEVLLDLVQLTDEQDGDGRIRLGALQNLGLLAENNHPLAQEATQTAIALAIHADVGLRVGAAGALAVLRRDGGREALVAALDDSELQVRATAALSLSRLDPPGPSAVPLLQDMTGLELWEAARGNSPGRFRRSSDIQRFRVWAAEALGRYGEGQKAFLEGLRESDDLQVREVAFRLLDTKS